MGTIDMSAGRKSCRASVLDDGSGQCQSGMGGEGLQSSWEGGSCRVVRTTREFGWVTERDINKFCTRGTRRLSLTFG